MVSKSNHITMGLISFILGIILAIQSQTISTIPKGVSIQRADISLYELKRALDEREKLQIDLNHTLKRLYDYEVNASKSDILVQALKEDIEKYEQAAGFRAVVGPGLLITIDNGPLTDLEANSSPFYVHHVDLLRIVNELFGSGAEAISINEERLIALTEIRSVGQTMLINGNRYGPPYIIKAIGDAAYLENCLKLRGGIIEELQLWGFQITLEKQETITIPGYTGGIKLRFARPVIENSE